MKNKVVHNVVSMSASQESPELDVRVTTAKKNEVHPYINLMLTEKDKYATIDPDTYQNIYEVILGWDTVDIVTFTLQWPDASTVTITRAFLAEAYDMPLVESVIAVNGDETSGQVYARQDTLNTYKMYESDRRKHTPNVKATEAFICGLSMSQDLDWETILKSYNQAPEVKDVLLEKTTRAEERFILDHKNRDEIKFIVNNFGIKSHTISSRALAKHALRVALKSIVDAIGTQLYGADYDIEKLFNAQVHFDTLGLQTKLNKFGLKFETVYAVDTSEKLHLVFGALDDADAKATFEVDHGLSSDEIELKKVNLIYHNLIN